MKRIAILILCGICLASLFAAGSKEENSLDTIKSRGTLIIATEGNWTPWTYHDANDVLTGFDVELGTLLAQSLGVKPEFQEVPWESILVGVEKNVFDIACNGVGYTAKKFSACFFFPLSSSISIFSVAALLQYLE